ncbi:MAG: hypothetical protein ACO1G9_02745 [Bacteroidota bacterium]
MQNLPPHIGIAIALTTLITIWFFFKATGNSKTVLIVLAIWLVIQSAISVTGFYTVTDSLPPRFLLLVLPPFLFIAGLFVTVRGKRFIDNLNVKTLTILHVIRIPVEIVLFWLFIGKTIPQLMTFEGRNFDILSGLSSPVIYYFGFVRKQLSKKVIIGWNLICLLLLFNIIVNAIFSLPFPFQKFAFDQPNIALLHFPFVWLPCCIVPIVLLSHLASIRILAGKSGMTEIQA